MLAEHENIYNTSDLERAMNLQQIFDNTDFVHASGTKEELQVAENAV